MIDWPSILLQIPIVGVFIWFSLETDKRNRESMSKRDAAYLGVLANITQKLEDHDLATRTAIAKMEERTRPLHNPRNAGKD